MEAPWSWPTRVRSPSRVEDLRPGERGGNRSRGGSFPHSHDLEKLANLAEGHGLAAVGRNKLHEVQCKAAVRYEAGGASRGDALGAHRLSLEIGGDVLVAM